MGILIEMWAGLFYLFQKVGLSMMERFDKKKNHELARKWSIWAWTIYILGLPPWVLILANQRNWIVLAIEVSGLPSMVLGLVMAIRCEKKDPPRWLIFIALAGVLIGLRYSFYDFGGINTLNQWLEVALSVGYLIGTYLLALKKPVGYFWYILMHVACAWLMFIEHKLMLSALQVISLGFIWHALRTAKTRSKPT